MRAEIVIQVRVNAKKYPRLVAWLEGQPNKSEAIRRVLEDRISGGDHDKELLKLILAKLDRLAATGLLASPGSAKTTAEDQEGADRFDAMMAEYT